MKAGVVRHSVFSAVIVIVTALGAHAQPDAEWAAVEQALGQKGAVQPGGVFRVGMPRSDLKVTVQGVAGKPGFAPGSYPGVRERGKGAMGVGGLGRVAAEVAQGEC